MKCPNCHEEMTVLCRRGSSGFLDEFYEKCLFCGYTFEVGEAKPIERVAAPKFGWSRRRTFKFLSAGFLAAILVFAFLQLPVPVKVFAFETSIERSYAEILSAITLVNFTLSDFRLNYSGGSIVLNVSADYARLTSRSVGENLTQYSFVLESVVLHYSDEARSLDLGLSSLTLNVEVNYAKLVVAVEGIANLPLWAALANRLFGTG